VHLVGSTGDEAFISAFPQSNGISRGPLDQNGGVNAAVQRMPLPLPATDAAVCRSVSQARHAKGADGSAELGALYVLMYGAIAGACAETVVFPLEVTRRQMQLNAAKAAHRERSASPAPPTHHHPVGLRSCMADRQTDWEAGCLQALFMSVPYRHGFSSRSKFYAIHFQSIFWLFLRTV
jgi:Mitochondrial carrier protein